MKNGSIYPKLRGKIDLYSERIGKKASSQRKLDKLSVIYPGEVDYLLQVNVSVVGIQNYLLR